MPGFILNLWDRLPFAARLLVTASLALVIASLAMLYVSGRNEALEAGEDLRAQLEGELATLPAALSELVVIGDYSSLQQTLESYARRPNVSSVEFRDVSGIVLAAHTRPPEVHAPNWFSGWIGLTAYSGKRDAVVGGRSYGTLSLTITPEIQINRAWGHLSRHLLILLLAISLDFLGIWLVLRMGLKPLRALDAGGQALGAGDLSVRIPLQGSPELRRSISAFNRMADEIGETLESLRTFSRAVEYSANSVVITDIRGNIEYVNPKFSQVTGYTPEEAIGQNSRLLKSGKTSEEEYRQLWETITGGGEWRGEFHNKRKDGSLYWESASISAIRNDRGEISHFVAVKEDITARKEAEANLQQLNETLEQRVKEEVEKNREKDHLLMRQSRLAAMGEMIGNIAHQWRQPLNGLTLLLVNLRDARAYNELSQAYLEDTVHKAEQLIHAMSATIDDFRNFFQPNREKLPFTLEQAVRDAITMVEASFREHAIEIVVSVADKGRTLGFRNEYAQAVTNMLGNAKDAILAGGVKNGRVEISISCRNDQGYVIIRDNGGGVPQEIMGKIFDPYFTTREKGTGVGLYMSKMIIENNMDGSIEVRNAGEGAEFVIMTPCGNAMRAKERT